LSDLKISQTNEGAILTVKVIPAARTTAISGLLDEMLKLKVAAPAEKGKANKSLIDFLAKKLGVRKNSIQIITGRTKPVKQIKISGLLPPEILKKLGLD